MDRDALLKRLDFFQRQMMFRLRGQKLPAKPRISFCTTCMGRLHHLKETFLKNIEDNTDYPDLEFILLNYNSPDGIDDWARQHLKTFIKKGKVRYYCTEAHPYFHVSHAKNIAHKLATGHILCNVDADNFTGKGFARFLAMRFQENPQRVVHGNWEIRRGSHGRLAMPGAYFFLAGGYDERMQGWGAEDLDLITRLNRLGLEDIVIENTDFLNLIQHNEEERTGLRRPDCRDSKVTHVQNTELMVRSMEQGHFRVNLGVHWGRSRVSAVRC